ncbi:hypothetical protein [Beijerinckia mobilis]|nr:hypothetical protein [Beijerinckia mobilis]
MRFYAVSREAVKARRDRLFRQLGAEANLPLVHVPGSRHFFG